jgi:uncharacterized protein (DUF924 family)
MRRDYESILEYWLGHDPDDPAAVAVKQPLWFASDPTTDDAIRERFLERWNQAVRGDLDAWAAEPRGALALVILLDQFSRNLHRGSPQAFAEDERALAVARHQVESGADRSLRPVERYFLYLPYEHAEDLELQRRAVALFERLLQESGPDWRALMEDALHWARLHLDIIARFGRFPHRNRVLGRPSTPAERQYLEEGGLSFGQ